MDFDAPQSRNEAILQNILGADNVLVDPQSRVEEILTAILTGTAYTKEAQSRIESLLLCILNGTDTDLIAQSRNEEILIAKIKGEEYTADPQSRIEELLIEWLESEPTWVLKTVSGIVIQIDDAIKALAESLSIALEPIQDLHGYDAPWPAGGGKNKLPPATDDTYTYSGVTITSKDGIFTIRGTASAGFNSKIFALSESVDMSPSTNKIAFLNNFTNGSFTVDFMRDTTRIHFWGMSENNRVASGWTDTGNEVVNGIAFYVPAGWSGDVTISPMFVLLADSNPTSFAPYANICPITGRDEVSVVRTGKNLLNPSTYSFQTIMRDGLTYTVQDDGTIHVTGTATAIGGPSLTGRFSLPNGTYTYLSELSQGVSCAYRGRYVSSGSTFSLPQTFTVDGTFEVYVNLYCKVTGTYDLTIHPQIEAGSTATTYEPYTGISLTILLGQTVYGGTVDATNGTLTITSMLEVFDIADSTEIKSQINFFSKASSTVATVGDYSRITFGVSSVDQSIYNRISSSYSAEDKRCNMLKHYFAYNDESAHWYRNTVLYCFFPTALVGSTRESVFNYLVSIKDTNPLSVMVELATPITVNLTPQELELLKNSNVISSDTGDVITLTYKAKS